MRQDSANQSTVHQQTVKPSHLTLGDALARVAGELKQLGNSMDRFQTLISPLLAGTDLADRVFLNEMQQFDHTVQKLVCLAEFIKEIATQLPQEWQVDAVVASKTITLAELSTLLSAPCSSSSAETGNKVSFITGSGECELF